MARRCATVGTFQAAAAAAPHAPAITTTPPATAPQRRRDGRPWGRAILVAARPRTEATASAATSDDQAVRLPAPAMATSDAATSAAPPTRVHGTEPTAAVPTGREASSHRSPTMAPRAAMGANELRFVYVPIQLPW